MKITDNNPAPNILTVEVDGTVRRLTKSEWYAEKAPAWQKQFKEFAQRTGRYPLYCKYRPQF